MGGREGRGVDSRGTGGGQSTMNPQSIIRTLSLVLCVLPVTLAARGAFLDGDALARDCEGFTAPISSAEERACAAYIEGFLDGATIEAAGAYEAGATPADTEATDAFSDRATRTRLGLDAANAPGFCLPETRSATAVVETVATKLSQAPHSGKTSAAQAVSAVLTAEYPCPAD